MPAPASLGSARGSRNQVGPAPDTTADKMTREDGLHSPSRAPHLSLR